MQRDDIRLGEKPVERDIFKPRRRIRECVVGEDSHSESLADVGEDASDLARADYACRLAVKVESCQPDKREVEVLCANGGAVDVARQRHQERGGVFSDGVGGIGGNAHDRKPGFVRRLEVDVIVSGAAHGENLDAALHKPFDHGTVNLGVHERTYRVASFGERQSRRRQPRLEVADVVPSVVLPLERLLVIRLGVEKRYLLHV